MYLFIYIFFDALIYLVGIFWKFCKETSVQGIKATSPKNNLFIYQFVSVQINKLFI